VDSLKNKNPALGAKKIRNFEEVRGEKEVREKGREKEKGRERGKERRKREREKKRELHLGSRWNLSPGYLERTYDCEHWISRSQNPQALIYLLYRPRA